MKTKPAKKPVKKPAKKRSIDWAIKHFRPRTINPDSLDEEAARRRCGLGFSCWDSL